MKQKMYFNHDERLGSAVGPFSRTVIQETIRRLNEENPDLEPLRFKECDLVLVDRR